MYLLMTSSRVGSILVVEKEMFLAAGWFDQTLHTGDDTLWIFRLSYLGDCLYIDRPMTVVFRGSDNSLTYDVRPAAAEKRWDAFIRVNAEIYWRLRQTHPQFASVSRERLSYAILARAELACAAGKNSQTRWLAKDALFYAVALREIRVSLILLLVPSLAHSHFRKKWYPR